MIAQLGKSLSYYLFYKSFKLIVLTFVSILSFFSYTLFKANVDFIYVQINEQSVQSSQL
jgi:hypothetical protein